MHLVIHVIARLLFLEARSNFNDNNNGYWDTIEHLTSPRRAFPQRPPDAVMNSTGSKCTPKLTSNNMEAGNLSQLGTTSDELYSQGPRTCFKATSNSFGLQHLNSGSLRGSCTQSGGGMNMVLCGRACYNTTPKLRATNAKHLPQSQPYMRKYYTYVAVNGSVVVVNT